MVCSLLMGGAAYGIYALCSRIIGTDGTLQMLVCMAAAVVAGVVVYGIVVVASRAITNEDMKLIPGGEKLGRILHMGKE